MRQPYKLEIGDRVRIIKFPNQSRIGLICEVTSLNEGGYACRVKSLSSDWACLMFANEIRKVPIKGRQLLFKFMYE